MSAIDGRLSPMGAIVVVTSCAVMDAFAVSILLVPAPPAASLRIVLAGLAHGVAVLILWGSCRARPSRRWLSAAATAAVPLGGLAVAVVAWTAGGRSSLETRSRRRARPATVRLAAIRRLGQTLSPCDALEHGDPEQRRDAVSELSRRGDPEAIALLRRAVARGDGDLALAAALALDRIGERTERQTIWSGSAELRHAAS
jgi:hypothetical protein